MRRSRSVLSHLALVALLVLLFWTFAPSEALTVSEKQALTELMETFPLLSNMSYVTHGADRWNPDQLDMVCSSVTFYGLSCSGPEVATVAMYVLSCCCVLSFGVHLLYFPHIATSSS